MNYQHSRAYRRLSTLVARSVKSEPGSTRASGWSSQASLQQSVPSVPVPSCRLAPTLITVSLIASTLKIERKNLSMSKPHPKRVSIRRLLTKPSMTALHLNLLLPYFAIGFLSILGWLSPVTSGTGSQRAVEYLLGIILSNLFLIVVTLPRLRFVFPWAHRVGMLLIIPSVVLNMARVDFILSAVHPHSFNQALSRTDALYFAVETVTTVGYGDIHPVSELARRWVTAQMLIGAIITVYVIAKLLTGRRVTPLPQQTLPPS